METGAAKRRLPINRVYIEKNEEKKRKPIKKKMCTLEIDGCKNSFQWKRAALGFAYCCGASQ